MDLRQPESGGGATSSDEYASGHNPNNVTTSESDNPLEPIREDHSRQPESGGGATSSNEYASGHQPNGVTTSESDHTLAPVIESCVNDQRRIVDNHASGEVRLDNHRRRRPHQTEDAQSDSTGQNVDGQNRRPRRPRPQPSGQNSLVYPSTHDTESFHDSESIVSDLDEAMRPERERFSDWLDSTTQKSDITIPDFLLSENRIYQTDESSKGLVAIINNFMEERPGTMVDEDAVRRLFTAGPFADAYELLDTARDLSSDQFALYLDELVTRLKTGRYHSFMLFIMSHADENGVSTYFHDFKDHDTISTEEITAKFDNVLLGQPRVFFINGAQGSNTQMIEGGMMKLNRKPTEFKIESRRELVESNHLITPRGCDMLVAFASVPGYVACRNMVRGSWYITTLVDVISQASNPRLFNMDIEEILTIVNDQLSNKKGQIPGREEGRQMPYYRSTLRKKFYLLPNPVLPDRL